MPITANQAHITEDEAKRLLPQVKCFFDLIVKRYDDAKYSIADYNELREVFETPSKITKDEIDRALRWKYGKPKKLPGGHAATINRLWTRWEYLRNESTNRGRLEALRDPKRDTKNTDFVSRAFLVHLVDPKHVPIIDQFNYRAVRCLLGRVRHAFPLGAKPRKYEDIELVHSFIVGLLGVWTPNTPTYQEMDRYLMMFGKHVAPAYRL